MIENAGRALFLCLMFAAAAKGQIPVTSEPLQDFHNKIDAWVLASTPSAPEVREADGLLLRRLYLGLNGLPPSLDEVNRYSADSTPDKYVKLVDDLLARPEFSEHWAEKIDVMLMERRGNTHIPQDQWATWLRAQIANRRPLNHLMADLLVADGAPGESRPSVRFLLDRAGDPHLITKDVARVYFGKDIQCAQCHNHPTIDSYLQSDYHGLFGFVAGIHMVEVADGDKKVQMIAEKSANESPFESVFSKGNMNRVLPHLFDAEELSQPWNIPGEDYQVSENGRPAKPVHSRREQLAAAIRSGSQDAFNRNLANRLWALTFGRGVIDPVDLIHADNPPQSEALLAGLATQLAARQFDLRSFLKDLVLSQTYQRGNLNFGSSESNSTSAQWLASTAQQAGEALKQYQPQTVSLRESKLARASEYKKSIEAASAIQSERLKAFAAVDAARTGYAQSLEALKKVNGEKAAADQALAAAQDKANKLKAAQESTSAALQAIGQDPELTNAVELLKGRATASAAAVEPLLKTASEKATAVQTAMDASTKAKDGLLVVQNSASEVNARYQEQSKSLIQARKSLETATLLVVQAEIKEAELRRFLDWQTQSAAVVQLAQQLDQRTNEVSQQQTTLNALIAAHQAAQQKLPEFLTAAETMTGQLSAKKLVVEDLTSKLNRVSTAKNALISSTELVSTPEKLGGAIEQLDLSASNLKEQLDVAQKECSAVEASVTQRQNELQQHMQVITQALEQRTAMEKQCENTALLLKQCADDLSVARSQCSSVAASISGELGKRFASSSLRALSAEQIGWSFLAANGVYKNYVDKHLAELEKASPATAEQQQDPQFLATRRAEAVRKARAELQGNINHFVTLYGNGPGQPQSDFFATPDQALYANNGGALFAWASPSNDNIASRAVAAANPTETAKLLYRGLLCRDPSESEIAAVANFLEQQPDQRARLVQEMVWSLMASAEFRFLP